MGIDERTRLLLGENGVDRLKKTRILVAGLGGVGSHCVEALARVGVGKLVLVDYDIICESNINRQSMALHSTLGMYKTEAMKARIQDISPHIQVDTHRIFIDEESIEGLMTGGADYIVDAIDNVSGKILLIREAKTRDIPVISSMGTGNKIRGDMLEIDDIFKTQVCPLCRIMRKKLRDIHVDSLKVVYSREMPVTLSGEMRNEKGRPVIGSVSFVPPVAGLLMAGEVIRDIIDRKDTGDEGK